MKKQEKNYIGIINYIVIKITAIIGDKEIILVMMRIMMTIE